MSRPPTNGYRNVSNGSAPSMTSSNSRLATAQMSPQQLREAAPAISRAERFEDEKRRIIESCFSKVDETGQLLESYITHIRITEDALYPSTPPPPDSAQENKKPRIIIIAVRNTGRVRMHKARENNNGSFSIGKTWNLEEMSAIESFSNTPNAPRDDREAQYRTWAGGVGFIVTITKPYYWQAGTSKEKDFFIASAVKIYKKYTKGAVPDLRGFDDKDRNAILGPPLPQSQSQAHISTPPSAASQQQRANVSDIPPALQPPSQPPLATREQSREASRYRASPGPPPSETDIRPPPSLSSSRLPSESPGARSVAPVTPRNPPSQVLRPFAASDNPTVFRPYGNDQQLKSYASNERIRSPPGEPRLLDAIDDRNGRLEAPTPPRVQERSDSPTIVAQKRSPSRQRDLQTIDIPRNAQNGVPEDIPPIMTGAALFASSRQRLQQQHQQQQQQQQQQQSASTPALAPLETASQTASARNPKSATSASSSDLNSSDAAAFGSITSYWGADNDKSPAARAQDPASPPTPERSRRRPTMETKPSVASLDLRPAPLSQARKAPVAEANSNDAGAPEVKPLAVQNKAEQILSNPIASKFLTSLASKDTHSAGGADDEKSADTPGEEFRPGLGPMIKKKAVADKFRTAANTAKAFKPRPGGAAEKILRARAERDAMAEPDGINAVVPRPVRPVTPSTENNLVAAHTTKDSPRVEVVPPTAAASTQENSWRSTDGGTKHRSVELHDDAPGAASLLQPSPSPQVEIEQLPQPQVRVKRRSMQNERYITELGVDRALLEGKGLEFESLLDEFGWRGPKMAETSLAELELNVKRELGRVEAGSWLSHNDSTREEKVQQVEALLDKVIAECDELDGLLTLYSVELGSLNDDIAFIEAQSQGLQVQSANQKVLHSELENLVQTMSLSRSVLEPLRYADMSQPHGLDQAEQSLLKLYEALVTMDPSIRSTVARPTSRGGAAEVELSRMAALREKKDTYLRESDAFCQCLMQHLDFTFTTSISKAKGAIIRPASSGNGSTSLNKDAYTTVRSELWMYSPVVLFTKEANAPAWQTIIRMYYQRIGPLYSMAFKENITSWRKTARRPTAEEAELLFTHQEKEGGGSDGVVGLTSTARRITVKRSHTLAKTLRGAAGADKHHSPVESRSPGALMSSEVFAAALDEMAPLVSQEQNFIVDMFHVTGQERSDFVDTVAAALPDQRHGTNILSPKPAEADREMARRTQGVMEEIFGFFAQELSTLLEWIVSNDPMQGVGVMAALEKHWFYLQESNQDFLLAMLQTLLSKLRSLWKKFVEEQIRAIEDTKVKVHKRKGVISFMKTFPGFSLAVENIFLAVAKQDYDGPADCAVGVRRMIDAAYGKINRAMFDSLKVIAKENPASSTGVTTSKQQGGGEDPEDKEMLNYYILIIENMNHYIEEVDDGGKEGVLAEWRGRAMLERSEALDAYIARVIRRPLGKLLDFVESLESLTSAQANPSTIASRPSYSRKAARGVFSQYDGKEVKRGIETLRRRIDKHFAEGDEEAISRSLTTLVTKECERSYERIIDRVEALISTVYLPSDGDKPVELEFGREDVRSGFRR